MARRAAESSSILQATYFDQKFYSTFVLAGDGVRADESSLRGNPALMRKAPVKTPTTPGTPAGQPATTQGVTQAVKRESEGEPPPPAVWHAPLPPSLSPGSISVRPWLAAGS